LLVAKSRSVLIIGGSSFVGTHLALAMRDSFKVFATYHKHPIHIPGVTPLPLAADDREWAKRVVYLAKPDAVIFAAGSNSVAAAEADPRIAEHVHVGGPATVADVADILQPKFIFIDGRTGTVMHSENFREEVLYNANQSTPALSSYFELMDRLIPSFLSTLSSQKIKGTRILLQ